MAFETGDTVYFIDIDETLFHQSGGLIKVLDWNGKVVEEIDAEAINNHVLIPGYRYCHDDFRSSDKFIANAKPIECTLNKLKQLIDENKNLDKPNLILILTARGDFDDKEAVLNFFESAGVPIKKYWFVDFIRTGNISDKKFTTAEKKQSIVLTNLIFNKYKNFVMWDDSITNLEKFYEVKQSSRTPVNFSFMHVIHDRKDGKCFNYRTIEVKDEDAIKYIDVYRAKRVLAKYGIDFYHPDAVEVTVGKDDENKPSDHASKTLKKADEKITPEEEKQDQLSQENNKK